MSRRLQTANEAYDKLQAMLQQCNRLGEYMGIGELNRAVEKSTEAATALDALLRSAEAGLLPSNPSGNASEARANLAAAADLLRIACDKLAKVPDEFSPSPSFCPAGWC